MDTKRCWSCHKAAGLAALVDRLLFRTLAAPSHWKICLTFASQIRIWYFKQKRILVRYWNNKLTWLWKYITYWLIGFVDIQWFVDKILKHLYVYRLFLPKSFLKSSRSLEHGWFVHTISKSWYDISMYIYVLLVSVWYYHIYHFAHWSKGKWQSIWTRFTSTACQYWLINCFC